ncbi:unnamed protein product [Lymnaea stagnalis]|uniref:Uncharacterized protein n=1 Tax=Lymnaea stagnalis TaxID=6523 RepID=A0AAV2I251_LYMST
MDETLTGFKSTIWIFLSLTFLLYPSDGAAVTSVSCPPQAVKCNSTNTCIQSKYVCDGDADCQDGEDELNCNVQASGCGDQAYKTAPSGSLASMDYPKNYSSFANCQWHINVPSGFLLRLEFTGIFDIEKSRRDQCVYDSVSVHQEEPWLFIGQFCGTARPGPVTLNSRKALVEFRSDGQTNGQGFQLMWTAQKDYRDAGDQATVGSLTSSAAAITTTVYPLCNNVMKYGGEVGHIESPNYQFGQPYPAPLYCRWHIILDPGFVVALDFEYLNIGEFDGDTCQDAWLEVYDGPDDGSPLVAKLCDAIVPAAIVSSSPTMFITMSAFSNNGQKRGFRAEYRALKTEPETTTTIGPLPPGCDGTPLVLSSDNGYITTPFYNHITLYPDGIDCEWVLVAPAGRVLTIKFHEFDLENSGGCDYDYLRIYDTLNVLIPNEEFNVNQANGSISTDTANETLESNLTQIASLCGIMLPYDIETGTSRAVLKFHSDAQYGAYGFNLSFTSGYPTEKCDAGEFKCGVPGCVNLTVVCDGVNDCSDGSDEALCYTPQCGRPLVRLQDTRIVGGSESPEGAWPWIVSITDSQGHLCGATLIHPQWAVTAAHCFETVFNRNYEDFIIIAGRHQLRVPDSHEQQRAVADVYMHREYVSSTSLNDVAVIKLREPFNLTDYVSAACLPRHKIPEETTCYIIGWGNTLGTCCTNKLKQAAVPIIKNSVCGGPDYYGDRLMDHMMCAGFPEGGVDSCDGDSGGPLMCESTLQDKHWELQGVTSWGVLCAIPKQPGVYTVVYDYLPWIQQTIALHWH